MQFDVLLSYLGVYGGCIVARADWSSLCMRNEFIFMSHIDDISFIFLRLITMLFEYLPFYPWSTHYRHFHLPIPNIHLTHLICLRLDFVVLIKFHAFKFEASTVIQTCHTNTQRKFFRNQSRNERENNPTAHCVIKDHRIKHFIT